MAICTNWAWLVSKIAKGAEFTTWLARFLPPDTRIAMKTGSVNASRTAAGIIYVPVTTAETKKPAVQPIAVCIMTDGNKDQRWVPDNAGDLLCAKIAKAVYDHFHQ